MGSGPWHLGVTWCHRSRDYSTRGGRLSMGGPLWPCVYLAPLRRYGASNVGCTDVDTKRKIKEGKKKEERREEGKGKGKWEGKRKSELFIMMTMFFCSANTVRISFCTHSVGRKRHNVRNDDVNIHVWANAFETGESLQQFLIAGNRGLSTFISSQFTLLLPKIEKKSQNHYF